MNELLSFINQFDRLCEQIATAIQGSETQIYANLAVILVAAFIAFPPKDDPDAI
jgi:hypothetical protein